MSPSRGDATSNELPRVERLALDLYVIAGSPWTQRSAAGEARRQRAHPIPSAGAEELRRDEDGQEDEHSERRKPVPHSPPAERDQPVDDAAAVEWRNRQQLEQGHRQVDDG